MDIERDRCREITETVSLMREKRELKGGRQSHPSQEADGLWRKRPRVKEHSLVEKDRSCTCHRPFLSLIIPHTFNQLLVFCFFWIDHDAIISGIVAKRYLLRFDVGLLLGGAPCRLFISTSSYDPCLCSFVTIIQGKTVRGAPTSVRFFIILFAKPHLSQVRNETKRNDERTNE